MYGSALASLLKSPADLAVAGRHLGDLPRRFDSEEHGLAAQALSRLLSEVQSVTAAKNATAEALEQEKSTKAADAEDQATAVEDSNDELKRLNAQNARLKSELKEALAELARKEEALEKLKEVVVGGGG